MKNFLLAVALLSIGTAVAAGSNNQISRNRSAEVTKEAKAAKNFTTNWCSVAYKQAFEEQGEPFTPGLEKLVKELCECKGKKVENYVKRTGSLPAESADVKFEKECKAAMDRKYK